MAVLIADVAACSWIFLSIRLPPAIQGYGSAILAVLIVLPAFAYLYWKRADWQNRATNSNNEALERERRARILGGE